MTANSVVQLPLWGVDFEEIRSSIQIGEGSLEDGTPDRRGAVYTRREVVNFILDLVGYTSDRPLFTAKVLEPCFGNGDFLLPIVERLVKSFGTTPHQRHSRVFERLKSNIRAVEVHKNTFSSTAGRLMTVLENAGFDQAEQDELLSAWLINGDFLLEPLDPGFDFVVGNPPYVRQEMIPSVLLEEYRKRYSTIYDRADIYIPFIERSLDLLGPSGALGFICANRWMKNRYGGPLRKKVSDGYRLKFYVDMVGADAFHSTVTAYPAITVITRENGNSTRLAHRPPIDHQELSALAHKLTEDGKVDGTGVREMVDIVQGPAPWILDSSNNIEVVRRLEKEFPALEDAGCQVGIGVATGADQVFIAPFKDLDVEESRKLPLVMTRDIQEGAVKWRGFGVVNPFSDQGGLVDLADYPRLDRYLSEHSEVIRKRHVAKKNPSDWYRTIDRITPSLLHREKLLIPDIKGEATSCTKKENSIPTTTSTSSSPMNGI